MKMSWDKEQCICSVYISSVILVKELVTEWLHVSMHLKQVTPSVTDIFVFQPSAQTLTYRTVYMGIPSFDSEYFISASLMGNLILVTSTSISHFLLRRDHMLIS